MSGLIELRSFTIEPRRLRSVFIARAPASALRFRYLMVIPAVKARTGPGLILRKERRPCDF
jgi:hypothetical protein